MVECETWPRAVLFARLRSWGGSKDELQLLGFLLISPRYVVCGYVLENIPVLSLDSFHAVQEEVTAITRAEGMGITLLFEHGLQKDQPF